jgi:hypothetical protein
MDNSLRFGFILTAAAHLVAAPANAQTNLERVVNGAFTPSHDYDLVHQRIEVKNFDWDSTSFDGQVTTTVVSLRPGLPSCSTDRSCSAAASTSFQGAARAIGAPARPPSPSWSPT